MLQPYVLSDVNKHEIIAILDDPAGSRKSTTAHDLPPSEPDQVRIPVQLEYPVISFPRNYAFIWLYPLGCAVSASPVQPPLVSFATDRRPYADQMSMSSVGGDPDVPMQFNGSSSVNNLGGNPPSPSVSP